MEQEKKNSLGELMKITMEHIKTMADANTIIGAPIQAEGVTLIPVSRMSFGMGGGGTEFTTKSGAPKEGFGGGSAASAKLEPVAFLIVREDGSVKLRLILDDDKGNLMTLEMLAVSQEQAGQLAQRFREQPEQLYQRIFQFLLEEP